jgi:starch synthase
MKILFPIAEAHPLYKIGGLGDVGGSLPQALQKIDLDVRIALPLHPEISLPSDHYQEASFEIIYSNKPLTITVLRTLLPGSSIPVYLFKEDTYLSQHTNASDNHADKFSVFSLAVSAWLVNNSPYWQPQIIHCHDWHTALIPVLLKHKFNKRFKSIITIHNLAYQGITNTPIVQNLGLEANDCHILSWDGQDGNINILLEGLLHADFITTVSPNYAKEIITDEYGEKINAILETKKAYIKGILNGLDVAYFDPQTDSHLTAKYSPKNWQQGKLENRQDLYRKLRLPFSKEEILIGFVGRADPYQKGIGLIIQAISENLLPPQSTRFIFLGTGDPALEKQLHDAAKGKDNVTIITRFDEPLAHQIYAASHLCLIPSRFEPCGLVQLIAMRYGSLPIVRKTGGFVDTVFHNQNGFLFSHYDAHDMMQSVREALQYISDEKLYTDMVDKAMKADYSWKASAENYNALYQQIYLEKGIENPHD